MKLLLFTNRVQRVAASHLMHSLITQMVTAIVTVVKTIGLRKR